LEEGAQGRGGIFFDHESAGRHGPLGVVAYFPKLSHDRTVFSAHTLGDPQAVVPGRQCRERMAWSLPSETSERSRSPVTDGKKL
jgi:hypothetical protein